MQGGRAVGWRAPCLWEITSFSLRQSFYAPCLHTDLSVSATLLLPTSSPGDHIQRSQPRTGSGQSCRQTPMSPQSQNHQCALSTPTSNIASRSLQHAVYLSSCRGPQLESIQRHKRSGLLHTLRTHALAGSCAWRPTVPGRNMTHENVLISGLRSTLSW